MKILDELEEIKDRLRSLEENQKWIIPQVEDYRTWRQRAWGIGISFVVAWTVLSGAWAGILKLIVAAR